MLIHFYLLAHIRKGNTLNEQIWQRANWHWGRPYQLCVFMCECDLYLIPGLVTPANNSSYTDYSLALLPALTHNSTHTHTSVVRLLSDSPWVLGRHTIIPLCLLTLFCCYILTPCGCMYMWVCVCVLSWPWPNIGSCSCQLLAQLRTTFIAFPRGARGLRARSRSTSGRFLLRCLTFPHPSAQMVWADFGRHSHSYTSHRAGRRNVGKCSCCYVN